MLQVALNGSSKPTILHIPKLTTDWRLLNFTNSFKYGMICRCYFLSTYLHKPFWNELWVHIPMPPYFPVWVFPSPAHSWGWCWCNAEGSQGWATCIADKSWEGSGQDCEGVLIVVIFLPLHQPWTLQFRISGPQNKCILLTFVSSWRSYLLGVVASLR